MARKIRLEYEEAIYHPPSLKLRRDKSAFVLLRRDKSAFVKTRRARQAGIHGFDESDTRPVWRGFARNIGQELFAASGKPAGELMACRNWPSEM